MCHGLSASILGSLRQGHPEPLRRCLWWKGLLRIRGAHSQGGAPPSAWHCDRRRPSHPTQKTESCLKLMELKGETDLHSGWRARHPCVSADGAVRQKASEAVGLPQDHCPAAGHRSSGSQAAAGKAMCWAINGPQHLRTETSRAYGSLTKPKEKSMMVR